MTVDTAQLKQQAAEHAVGFIESGMIVGLGHGSTAIYAIRKLAQRLAEGTLKDVQGIPCSHTVEAEARQLGIPLTTLDEYPVIDLTIDGADEVDPRLDVIKGGGGALLHEKIVAQATRREIIVVDETKMSQALGTIYHIPIEVVQFGWRTQQKFLEDLGAKVKQRRTPDGAPFITDEGNFILDADFGPLHDPYPLTARLEAHVGIVEHGLFLNMVSDVIVASAAGIRHLRHN